MTNKQRQKNQLRVSEIKQRLKTISGHEGPPELPGPLVGEWLSAESRLEVKALATELKDLEWRLDERLPGKIGRPT